MGQNSSGLLITDLKQPQILQKLEPLVDKELKQAFKIYEELDMMICNTNDFIKIDQKFTEVK